jgi:hypothetical protein
VKSSSRHALELTTRVDPYRLGILLAVCIAVLVVAGTPLLGERHPRLHLEEEENLPAAFSACLLLAVGVLAVLTGDVERRAGRSPRPWTVIGLFFAFMAVDEYLVIHERFQDVAGQAWWGFYLPVMLLGGIIWLMTLRRLPPGFPTAAFVAGAAAWLVSQAIEAFLWGGGDTQIPVTLTLEELLEMSGSASFLLAFLAALRVAARSEAVIAGHVPGRPQANQPPRRPRE